MIYIDIYDPPLSSPFPFFRQLFVSYNNTRSLANSTDITADNVYNYAIVPLLLPSDHLLLYLMLLTYCLVRRHHQEFPCIPRTPQSSVLHIIKLCLGLSHYLQLPRKPCLYLPLLTARRLTHGNIQLCSSTILY